MTSRKAANLCKCTGGVHILPCGSNGPYYVISTRHAEVGVPVLITRGSDCQLRNKEQAHHEKREPQHRDSYPGFHRSNINPNLSLLEGPHPSRMNRRCH